MAFTESVYMCLYHYCGTFVYIVALSVITDCVSCMSVFVVIFFKNA